MMQAELPLIMRLLGLSQRFFQGAGLAFLILFVMLFFSQRGQHASAETYLRLAGILIALTAIPIGVVTAVKLVISDGPGAYRKSTGTLGDCMVFTVGAAVAFLAGMSLYLRIGP